MEGTKKSEKIYAKKTLFQLVLMGLNLESEFTSLGKISYYLYLLPIVCAFVYRYLR